jgi:hypothetical protein
MAIPTSDSLAAIWAALTLGEINAPRLNSFTRLGTVVFRGTLAKASFPNPMEGGSGHIVPHSTPFDPAWDRPPSLSDQSEEKATDCEGRKSAKETAHEITAPTRPASQVRAQIRIRLGLKTKLRHHLSTAFGRKVAGSNISPVSAHGWAKR